MFDDISKALDVECIETESDFDMDNMGLGLNKKELSTGNTYDIIPVDDEDEPIEVSDEDIERTEIRKKVFKNMDTLVTSAMSALPHVIKEVKFTDDSKVFTSAAAYISAIAKLNEQYLSMADEPDDEPENKGTKKGEKGKPTQSTVTNNIIMTNANDIFDKINNR